jgi:predicted alpha/beta hydrolase
MNPDLPVARQHLTLSAADGYPLVATLYTASAVPCRAHLLIAGATGVPQGFHGRALVWWARLWLTEQHRSH